jgi:hypothetical protein
MSVENSRNIMDGLMVKSLKFVEENRVIEELLNNKVVELHVSDSQLISDTL